MAPVFFQELVISKVLLGFFELLRTLLLVYPFLVSDFFLCRPEDVWLPHRLRRGEIAELSMDVFPLRGLAFWAAILGVILGHLQNC